MQTLLFRNHQVFHLALLLARSFSKIDFWVLRFMKRHSISSLLFSKKQVRFLLTQVSECQESAWIALSRLTLQSLFFTGSLVCLSVHLLFFSQQTYQCRIQALSLMAL